MAQSQRSPLRTHPALIVASLVFCFPIGLVLVWTHPYWSKSRKWVWTGGLGVGLVLLTAIASVQDAARRKHLDEADRLWTAGNKVEAVVMYKTAIDGGVASMDQPRRPTVFQRVIEFEAEQGNLSAAKQLAVKAETYGVPLASEVPAVREMLAEVQAEAAAKKQAKASSNDGSAGGAGTAGAKTYQVTVESRAVSVEVSSAVAAEVELSGLAYSKSDWRINLKVKLLKAVGKKYTHWRYTLYDKSGTALNTSELIHPDLGVGESGTSYIYLGPDRKDKVVRVVLE